MQASEGDRARLSPADMQSAMDARQGVYGLGVKDNGFSDCFAWTYTGWAEGQGSL